MKYSLIIRIFILFCITNSCIQATKCFAQTQSLRITARFKNVFHVPFKIVEVVDNRNTSNTIAIYNTGFDNLPMVQNFTTLFDVDFLDYVNYSYVMQDTVEVKIVLNDMKISMRKESMNTSTSASADFSFYIKKNEKWELAYQVKPSTRSSFISTHIENIIFLYETAIDNFYKKTYPEHYQLKNPENLYNRFVFINYGIGPFSRNFLGLSLMYPIYTENEKKHKPFLEFSFNYVGQYKKNSTYDSYQDIQGTIGYTHNFYINSFSRFLLGAQLGVSFYSYRPLPIVNVENPILRKNTLFLGAKQQYLLLSNSRFQAAVGLYQNYHPTRLEFKYDLGVSASIVWSLRMNRNEK